MKAVVVEIRGRKAAALSADGQVRLVSNRNFVKGEVIEVKQGMLSGAMTGRLIASVLAAALLVTTIGVSSYAYFTPVSTVSLDVNPSLLFNLNRFERVLSVLGMGAEGEQIASQIRTTNKNVNAAISLALQQMKQEGHLGQSDQDDIVITASFKNAGQEKAFAARLKVAVEEELEDLEVEAEVEAEGIGYERVIAARELNMTPGRLNLLQKLQASSAEGETEYSIEEWRDKPVKEIMLEIKENRMKEKEVPPGQDSTKESPGKGNSENNGQGQGKDKGK